MKSPLQTLPTPTPTPTPPSNPTLPTDTPETAKPNSNITIDPTTALSIAITIDPTKKKRRIKYRAFERADGVIIERPRYRPKPNEIGNGRADFKAMSVVFERKEKDGS